MRFGVVMWRRVRGRKVSEFGGAAIEYVLVSTFGLLVTLAAIGMLGKVFERKFVAAAEKLGVSGETLDVGQIFGNAGDNP